MKRVVIVSIGLVLLLGCGGKRGQKGSVSGTISYKGKPVNGAQLLLHPTSGKADVVRVGVSQEGTFNGNEIPPGEYKIVVEGKKLPPNVQKKEKPSKGMDPAKQAEMDKKFQQVFGKEAPTIPFPDKYKKKDSTDLKCTVSQGKEEKLTLDLKD